MNDERNVQGGRPPERRLLTLAFFDLVDFTGWSHRLDPEQLRDLLQQSRGVCARVVHHYGGHVASYAGDGMLVCFGYPVASEQSAQAAVNASLDLVKEHARRRWELPADLEGGPCIRAGIHVGLVVIGDMTTMPGQVERDAIVGAAPNIASRIQSEAPPNGVVISDAVERLVRNQFELRSQGRRLLRGAQEAIELFEVVGRKSFSRQVDRPSRSCFHPLIGREPEWQRLRQLWGEAQRGESRTVVVRGEPGIGKSRLTRELVELLRAEGNGELLEFIATPYHTTASFFPLARCLAERMELDECAATPPGAGSETLTAKLAALGVVDPVDRHLVAEALGLAKPSPALLLSLNPKLRKTRGHEIWTRCFETLRGGRPAIYLFDDVQWLDASSQEWLAECAPRLGPGTLLVLTSREAVPWLAGAVEEISLTPLDEAKTRQLAREAAGKTLPREAVEHIVARAAGVPLYVEELTTALLCSGALEEEETHFKLRSDLDPARWSEVPATLHGLLQKRIESVGQAREMLQLCAVIGQTFPATLPTRLWTDGGPEVAQTFLDDLVREGLLEEKGDGPARVLAFKHALLRGAAYESLLRSRRAVWHRAVAEALQTAAGSSFLADPSLMAQHFSLAGLPEAAIGYWAMASAQSLARSAYAECIAQARSGLALLAGLGAAGEEQREQALALNATLGTALISLQGFSSAEAQDHFERTRRLARDTGSPARRFHALWGLWVVHLMQGRLPGARDLARDMRELAEATGDTSLRIEALWTGGVVEFYLGHCEKARAALQAAVELYQPEHHHNALLFGQNPGVAARVYLAFVLCFLGRHQEAEERLQEALKLARQLGHAHSLAWALGGETMLRLVLGDLEGTVRHGAGAVQYAMEQGHHWWHCATRMMVAWATMRGGQHEAGMRALEEGIVAYERLGSRLVLPVFCALLADGALAAGDPAGAARWTARGERHAHENEELLALPALWLLRGEMALRAHPPRPTEAEEHFRAAWDLARDQQSRLRQLQAALALASVQAARGDVAGARAVLAPSLEWYRRQPLIPLAQAAEQLDAALAAVEAAPGGGQPEVSS